MRTDVYGSQVSVPSGDRAEEWTHVKQLVPSAQRMKLVLRESQRPALTRSRSRSDGEWERETITPAEPPFEELTRGSSFHPEVIRLSRLVRATNVVSPSILSRVSHWFPHLAREWTVGCTMRSDNNALRRVDEREMWESQGKPSCE